MSIKLKSIFKKQVPRSDDQLAHSNDQDNRVITEKKNGIDTVRYVEKSPRSRKNDQIMFLRNSIRRHHKTSLGVLEDILKCPICNEILHVPRMLKCQHTFCNKCLIELKLDKTIENEDHRLPCPVCGATTECSNPDNLPTNRSIDSLLRAVSGSFVEARPDKRNSLFVNFGPLIEEWSARNSEATYKNQANQLEVTIEQLQATLNKLELRIREFKERADNLKETITREFEAKVAALREEQRRKMEFIDHCGKKGEGAAHEIREMLVDAEIEFVKRIEVASDIDQVNDKTDALAELNRRARDAILNGLSWQAKAADLVDARTGDATRWRDKDSKPAAKPRLVGDRRELDRPSGLALDRKYVEVYVACPGSGQVVVFDRQFKVMRRIQSPHMIAPQSVAFVEARQEIFVTDKWKHTILVFNRKGQLLRRIGEKGKAEGQLRCPEGLDTLESSELLFVADTGNDRVQIFNLEGRYQGGIGTLDKFLGTRPPTLGEHNLNQPTDVAISSNAVIVADCGHHKIKVFNHKLQLMFSIGGFGTFRGLLKSPEVVKLDEQGNILVGDSDNGRVQVFSPQGTLLRTFGSSGLTIGHFGWVSGLVCLPNNNILVADSKNNTLQLF